MEASPALARIRGFELSPARFVQVAIDEHAPSLADRRQRRRRPAHRLGSRLQSLAGLRARPPAAREGHPRVRRVREPARRRRRDHAHAASPGSRLVGRPGCPAGRGESRSLVFLGALSQAPLGYLAVASDLRWPVVTAHLLLSIALLAGAVVLDGRGAQPARRQVAAARPTRAAPARDRLRRRGLRARRQRHLRDRGRPALRRAASTSTASARSSRRSTSTAPSSASSCSRSCSRSGISPPTATVRRGSSASASPSLALLLVQMGDRRAPVADEAAVGARSRARRARRGGLGGHRRAGRAVLPSTAVPGSSQHLD